MVETFAMGTGNNGTDTEDDTAEDTLTEEGAATFKGELLATLGGV